MPCEACGSDEVELCSCTDGSNAFTVSTSNTTIANPMTLTVSNSSQYTGKWAVNGQLVFIEGYGYYKCTSSTATSITVAFPPSPYVGGATYSVGSVDYDNSGTIPSGTKISPGGAKGATGTASLTGTLIGATHDGYITSSLVYTDLLNGSSAAATQTITANQLSAVGDSIRIKAKYFIKTSVDLPTRNGLCRILLNGVSITLEPSSSTEFINLYGSFPYFEADVFITYKTSTTADVRVDLSYAYKSSINYATDSVAFASVNPIITFETLGLGGFDWTSSQSLVFQGKVANAAEEVKMGFLSVEFLKKIS